MSDLSHIKINLCLLPVVSFRTMMLKLLIIENKCNIFNTSVFTSDKSLSFLMDFLSFMSRTL